MADFRRASDEKFAATQQSPNTACRPKPANCKNGGWGDYPAARALRERLRFLGSSQMRTPFSSPGRQLVACGELADGGGLLMLGINLRSNPAMRDWRGFRASREGQSNQGSHPLADGGGFEPPVSFPTHAFQACTIDHSVTHPFPEKGPDTIPRSGLRGYFKNRFLCRRGAEPEGFVREIRGFGGLLQADEVGKEIL